MAVVRARSAPPYGLIAFAVLFVAATVVAVLMYLQWGTAQQKLDSLSQRYNAIAGPAEMATADEIRRGVDKAPTSIAAAQSQINGFKTLLLGNTSASYNDALNRAAAALRAAGADKANLVEALTSVSADRDALKRNLDDATRQLAGINSQVTNAGSAATERVNSLQKSIEDLNKQLAAANEQVAKANEARNQAVAAGEGRINELTAQMEQMRRDTVLKEDQAKQEIAKRDEIVQQLKVLVGNVRGNANVNVGEADGRVVRVNAANGEAWIDLGADQRIVPGMTFTVYDARTGVRFGNEELAAGKGSIEVISPGTNGLPSLCRITRTTKGQAIQANDVISNVVYHADKNRKSRFTIVGNIDLDGDGNATPEERDRLIDLVKRWGGQVDATVSTQTDYLVTGTQPVPAALAPGEGAATQPGSATDERNKERERFDSSVNEAKQLSIPVLNANRFLSMIGYYSTTVIRR
jgi:hypothetical protein